MAQNRFSPSSKRGFTLIELLIVIAIILILIAIALPNFLEAQIRAKVARVKSEFRTIEVAMESYRTDYSRYAPPSPDGGFTPGSTEAQVIAQLQMTPWTTDRMILLTTPIKYLTDVNFEDPFMQSGMAFGNSYAVTNYHICSYNFFGPTFLTGDYAEPFDSWATCSFGPDYASTGVINIPVVEAAVRRGIPGSYNADWHYSPTNGTNSKGDICRVGMSAGTPDSAAWCR